MRRACLATWVLALATVPACDRVFQLGELPAIDASSTVADESVPPECTTAAQCTTAAEPVCGDDQTCRACAAHSECATSNACLPSGACGDDTNVVYVAATGNDANTCMKAEPCKTLSFATTKGKPFIKVESNLIEGVVIENRNVTVLAAPGTQITPITTGPVLDLRGTSTVALYDLVITGGLGMGGHGITVGSSTSVNLTLERVKVINNGGNGLNVQSGTIKLARTVISGNTMGGANITAVFDITNSLFVGNGSGNSTTGGLYITPQSGASVFQFNTVANNLSSDPAASIRGMGCAFTFLSSNILIHNNLVSATCEYAYSLFPPGTTVTGTNQAGDAAFKNTDSTNPLGASYFRIGSTSAAIDGADPATTVMSDIDGDSRPQGGSRDIGADEYK